MKKIDQLVKLSNEYKDKRDKLNTKIKRMQREKCSYDVEIEKIEKNIKTIHTNCVEISDHAVVRYLERVNELDIEKIKNNIIDDRLKTQIMTLGGNGKFVTDKYRVIVNDYKVTTIY